MSTGEEVVDLSVVSMDPEVDESLESLGISVISSEETREELVDSASVAVSEKGNRSTHWCSFTRTQSMYTQIRRYCDVCLSISLPSSRFSLKKPIYTHPIDEKFFGGNYHTIEKLNVAMYASMWCRWCHA